MKLSIWLLALLSFILLLSMTAEAQSGDSADDESPDGSSVDEDEAEAVTVAGNSALYEPSGYYQPPSPQDYYGQQYGGGSWKKSSSSWRKRSSSSSSWGKSKSWKSGGHRYKPKCPFGLAQIWFGSLSEIPYGYQVCDGSNGTPDLRDRLVIGAGSQFPFSTAGGNVEITLTEAQLAPHKHGAGSLMANTAGEHTHRFRTKVDGGEHEHHQFNLNADPAGGHAHDLNLDTGSGGDHDHTFDIYEQADYDTPEGHTIFDVPLDAVNSKQSYAKEVSDHLGHTHPVQGMTEPVDDHTHTVSGYIGKDGDHCHYIDAFTDPAGAHEHPIVGDTDITGEGAPINIMNPYHALYFICCGKQEPPPSWKKSNYY